MIHFGKFLFIKSNRTIILDQLDDHKRADVAKYGQMLSVIIRVFSSSKSVNIDEYKAYCLALYNHILTAFIYSSGSPWVSISPTLHKLLAHLWELISLNDGEGLQRLDESGLEGCNKILRAVRTRQARKASQEACNEDCLGRMWAGSDPVLQTELTAALPFCKHCVLYGHGTRYCPNRISNKALKERRIFLSKS